MIAVILLTAGCIDCNRGGTRAKNGDSTPVNSSSATDWFVDRAQAAGLDFVHLNGMSGQFYFPEVMPPGVALFDYDNDGDLDVYFVQGKMLGRDSAVRLKPDTTYDQTAAAPKGRLFRNDLTVDANGGHALHFTDVTERSRIEASGYGMGVAAADIDNDGWIDLYLTNFGANQMFRNNGDGTFTDISSQSGTAHAGFSVSAAFVDYDRDGWLDLYVADYVTYTIASDQKCTDLTGVRGYCPPQVYAAAPDHLYRNQQNGSFADVTDRALLGRAFGRGLGVVAADVNNDGWPDIYVANDGGENLLWINLRNGTFRNDALVAGVAVTAEGHAEASMGVDAGDFDNDGDDDLFVTELNGEGSNLFVNDGSGMFEDQSSRSGVGPASLQYTGFGTAWFDFDNDGWLDLLSVNGRVQAAEGAGARPFPMDQRKLLFRNLHDGRFEEVGSRAGAAFRLSEVGRGAAFGDIDNDGDQDVLVANDAGRPRLLLNNLGNHNHWVGVRLVGTPGRRDMLGTYVDIIRKDGQASGTRSGPSLRRRARSDGSYASSNDPRILIGLGDSDDAQQLRIRWPDGRVETRPALAANTYHTVVEGTAP